VRQRCCTAHPLPSPRGRRQRLSRRVAGGDERQQGRQHFGGPRRAAGWPQKVACWPEGREGRPTLLGEILEAW